MKKIITVLLILTLCSFLIFASDGKTRIGTNATLSGTYIPYGEDENYSHSASFHSDRLGIDLTIAREVSDNFSVEGAVSAFIAGSFDSIVGGSSSGSFIFQPSLGFKGGAAYKLGVLKLSGGLQYIHLRATAGSSSGSAHILFLGYYYGLDLDFQLGNTTRLLLGTEMGDSFATKLRMEYGGNTTETNLDTKHRFFQTGNLVLRAGLSWSL